MPKRWTIAGSQAHLRGCERREIWSPHGRDAVPPRQPIDQPQLRELRPINAGMVVCPSSCSANFSPRFGWWAVRVSSETSLLAAAGSRVTWESPLELRSSVGSIRRMNIRSPWMPRFAGFVIGNLALPLRKCVPASSGRSRKCAEKWHRSERLKPVVS
jgi:hypothetical protein